MCRIRQSHRPDQDIYRNGSPAFSFCSFSMDCRIEAFLHEYDYVQEFGEGVDRMYKEMEKAGLPAPEYKDVAFMLHVTIRNGIGASGATSDTTPGPK